MALNPVPQTNQNLNQTQNPILQNFSTIDSAFSVNHVPYGSSSPAAGKHNFVSMPAQLSDPGTIAGEMALYTKLVAGTAQLFLQTDNSAAVLNISSALLTTANSSTTLPSGVIVKWGTATSASNGLSTVAFITAFPTALLSVVASVSDASGSSTSSTDNLVRVYTFSKSGFNAVVYFANTSRTRVADTYSWLAIGY